MEFIEFSGANKAILCLAESSNFQLNNEIYSSCWTPLLSLFWSHQTKNIVQSKHRKEKEEIIKRTNSGEASDEVEHENLIEFYGHVLIISDSSHD